MATIYVLRVPVIPPKNSKYFQNKSYKMNSNFKLLPKLQYSLNTKQIYLQNFKKVHSVSKFS